MSKKEDKNKKSSDTSSVDNVKTEGRAAKSGSGGANIFTKETLGMLTVLFTALILVCLITRELVFPFGKAVSDFFYGLFGWFAYVECAALIYAGVTLVAGKGLNIPKKTRIFAELTVVALALLLQTITTWDLFDYDKTTYGQYLINSYKAVSGGLKDVTAGGLAVSLVSYWGIRLFHQIGFLVVAAAGTIALLACTIKSIADSAGASSSRGRIDIPVKKVEETEDQEKKPDPYDVLSDFADIPVGKPAAKNPLNVYNPGDFELRGKKDAAPNVNVNNVGGGLYVASIGTSERKVTSSDDMKTKIDYIKNPKPINVDETLSRLKTESKKTSDYNVSDVIKREDLGSPTASSYTEDPADYEGVFTVKPEKTVDNNTDNTDKREVTDIPVADGYNKAVKRETAPDNIDYNKNSDDLSDIGSKETDFTADTYHNSDYPAEKSGTSDYNAGYKEEKTYESDSDIDKIFKNVDENPSEDYIDVASDEETFTASEKEEKEPELKPTRIMGFGNNEASFGKTDKIDEKDEVTNSDVSDDEEKIVKTFVADDEPVSEKKTYSERTAKKQDLSEETEEPVPEKKPEPINRPYFVPSLNTFVAHEQSVRAEPEDHEGRMRKIEEILQTFHYPSKCVNYIYGPSFTRYELTIPSGQSVRTATKFDYDLTAQLEVKDGVRIQAPIPGKNLIGVEVANKTKIPVSLKSVLEVTLGKPVKPGTLMFAIGKDLEGNVIEDDLARAPHFLVAGSTGSGKSVCLNCLIISLIMRYSPEDLKLVLVDPKLNEFKAYQHLPHLATDEIITEPQKVLTVLDWAYEEMERRNKIFSESGSAVKEIKDYNKLIASDTVPRMPRIVIIIDELADLMQQVQRDLEKKIMALAQKSRSAGIHLVLATQRPSVDVITGVIKANLPARIAFKVMTFGDSQTILGEAGAEKLLGRGDMLYKGAEMGAGVRYQGAFVSGDEIDKVVQFIIGNNEAYFNEELAEKLEKTGKEEEEEMSSDGEHVSNTELLDPLFITALQAVIDANSASISMLQRRFQIGYSKAGGLIDKMEQMGYISSFEGSKARKVLITRERFDELYGG